MLGNISFLDIFDVYRVLLGMVSAELIFVEHAARHREHFMRESADRREGNPFVCAAMHSDVHVPGNSRKFCDRLFDNRWLVVDDRHRVYVLYLLLL